MNRACWLLLLAKLIFFIRGVSMLWPLLLWGPYPVSQSIEDWRHWENKNHVYCKNTDLLFSKQNLVVLYRYHLVCIGVTYNLEIVFKWVEGCIGLDVSTTAFQMRDYSIHDFALCSGFENQSPAHTKDNCTYKRSLGNSFSREDFFPFLLVTYFQGDWIPVTGVVAGQSLATSM